MAKARARHAAAKKADKGGNGKPALPGLEDYRHPEATRKNNPPAALASAGKVPAIPKVTYEYNPHLPPVLRFDETGQTDRLPELLAAAKKRALTADELATERRDQRVEVQLRTSTGETRDVETAATLIHRDGTPSDALRDRVNTAVQLYKDGRVPVLLMTAYGSVGKACGAMSWSPILRIRRLYDRCWNGKCGSVCARCNRDVCRMTTRRL